MLENLNRKFYMADDGDGYGYGEDVDAKVSPFVFGLNENAKLKKFEWIANGGKDGAEQEALEIIFEINSTERSYRQFPVVKAFGKNQEEITDPTSPEMKAAKSEFNTRMTHLMHAYVEDAALKQALARKIGSFKEYCNILKSLLPKNTPDISIDIFMQYQWQMGSSATRTFLDIPTKRKHGAFIVKHVEPVGGSWKAVKKEQPDDNVQDALTYIDGAGNKHPFQRTGWFMNSNFANQQSTGSSNSDSNASAGAAMNGQSATTDTASQAGAAPVASTW